MLAAAQPLGAVSSGFGCIQSCGLAVAAAAPVGPIRNPLLTASCWMRLILPSSKMIVMPAPQQAANISAQSKVTPPTRRATLPQHSAAKRCYIGVQAVGVAVTYLLSAQLSTWHHVLQVVQVVQVQIASKVQARSLLPPLCLLSGVATRAAPAVASATLMVAR